MTLPLLRDDSLITTPDGVAVRVSLPWIRSLPLTSLQKPIVTIDGVRPMRSPSWSATGGCCRRS